MILDDDETVVVKEHMGTTVKLKKISFFNSASCVTVFQEIVVNLSEMEYHTILI